MSLQSALSHTPADQPNPDFRFSTPKPPAPPTQPSTPTNIRAILATARTVQNKAELTVGCKVRITGGPHRDHETAVITGEASPRFWLVVSTSTRFVQNFSPFAVEKVNVAPGL